MGLKIMTQGYIPAEELIRKSGLAYHAVLDNMRRDVSEYSKGKYNLEDLTYRIKAEDKQKADRYLRAVEEDIFRNLEEQFLYYKKEGADLTEYANRINGLHYDFNRIGDFTRGEHFILKTDKDFTLEDINGVYDSYKSVCLPYEDYSMTVSIQAERFMNLLIEMGNTGIYNKNGELKRLSVSVIDEAEICLLGEYEFHMDNPDIMYLTRKSATLYCAKNCRSCKQKKLYYNFTTGEKPRFGSDVYCELK